MTPSDWDLIIRDGAMVITTIVVPFGLWAYSKRTGVQITDQERAAVQGALTTAAGIIRTQVDQGVLTIGDVHPANDAVMREARAALARVPDSAAAQGVTPDAAAAIIVGRVDTAPKPPRPVLMLPASDPPPVSMPAPPRPFDRGP